VDEETGNRIVSEADDDDGWVDDDYSDLFGAPEGGEEE
jgi:hypothetical protein